MSNELNGITKRLADEADRQLRSELLKLTAPILNRASDDGYNHIIFVKPFDPPEVQGKTVQVHLHQLMQDVRDHLFGCYGPQRRQDAIDNFITRIATLEKNSKQHPKS